MNRQFYILLFLVTTIISGCEKKPTYTIYVENNATILHAGEELSEYLSRMYPELDFKIVGNDEKKQDIVLCTQAWYKLNCSHGDSIDINDGFSIFSDKEQGFVIGKDAGDVLYGVYALLEKLGCEFYLSFERVPEKDQPFSFEDWDLSDKPTIEQRIVLNWHNFLSGCTGWDLDDWQFWISQLSKMKFNTIMVHAYGNNPMFQWEFRGEEKPVGYIANTARGRDWGTQHVNDVRRLYGGQIFNEPVWGATCSKVPESQMKDTTTRLMQDVFKYADVHSMDVIFAYDIDRPSTNPEIFLNMLSPESILYNMEDMPIVNPSTNEGYAYYKSQVEWLLKTYPEIDVMAPWIRGPLMDYHNLDVKNLPLAWEEELNKLMADNPSIESKIMAEGTILYAKIVDAFKKALEELDAEHVKLAIGTWTWKSFPVSDLVFDKDIIFIPIDWKVDFNTDKTKQTLQRIKEERQLYPIVWAHHDDYAYIGAPFVPYDNFNQLLEERGAENYGIIHWTTRPLDPYFKSLARQSWENTMDYNVITTASDFSQACFGLQDSTLNQYIYDWLTEGPRFGRETSDRFYDLKVPETFPEGSKINKYQECITEIKESEERMELLKRVDTTKLDYTGRSWYNYFKGSEEFFTLFFTSQKYYIKASEAIKNNDIEKARTFLQDSSKHAEAIKKYTEFIQYPGLNKGEEAMVISLNLRWLPFFTELEQQLGLQPYIVNFGPTSHEPLAQIPGNNTFLFFEDGRIAKTLGEKETTANAVFENNIDISGAFAELYKSGIEGDTTVRFSIKSMTNEDLAKGQYKIEFLVNNPDLSKDISFFVQIVDKAKNIVHNTDVTLSNNASDQPERITSIVNLKEDGLTVQIVPQSGKFILNGAIITRIY